ncbi:hypothetical protein H4219_002661 [Mycoemilia scoparia]|uniref:Uncharacterized protein n=1 Tax=Mycoemilia scoparia TaxID=417184 RepID=A0A9W8A4Z1_9FUNG|nr:hypothetical protein H4219_002661 [Mycoemilia scoparia]
MAETNSNSLVKGNDPRRSDSVVKYLPAEHPDDGSGLYASVAYITSFAALIIKIKWLAWISVFAAVISIGTYRASTSANKGSNLSTFL